MKKISGTIYVIRMGDDGPIKIGFTAGSAACRLKQLQTGNPSPLRIIMEFDGEPLGERLFHGAFTDHKLVGEWFQYSDDIIEAIRTVAETCGGLPTLPPMTLGGRRVLHDIARYSGFDRRYPDGSYHWENDWDAIDRDITGFQNFIGNDLAFVVLP